MPRRGSLRTGSSCTTGLHYAGDIVLISDLKGQLGYPVLGRVRSLEQDSDGVNRYFVIEYKRSKVNAKCKDAVEKVSFSVTQLKLNFRLDFRLST